VNVTYRETSLRRCTVWPAACRQKGLGLTDTQLRERLTKLQELHNLPEHRVEPGLNSDGQDDQGGGDDAGEDDRANERDRGITHR
jgi:hypothetical protein